MRVEFLSSAAVILFAFVFQLWKSPFWLQIRSEFVFFFFVFSLAPNMLYACVHQSYAHTHGHGHRVRIGSIYTRIRCMDRIYTRRTRNGYIFIYRCRIRYVNIIFFIFFVHFFTPICVLQLILLVGWLTDSLVQSIEADVNLHFSCKNHCIHCVETNNFLLALLNTSYRIVRSMFEGAIRHHYNIKRGNDICIGDIQRRYAYMQKTVERCRNACQKLYR